jgi:hypothetical protein
MDARTPKAPKVPGRALVQKTAPFCPVNEASQDPKPAPSKSRGKLEWQPVNPATWRLVDPDGAQIRIAASHGQWGGFSTPTALAWVFDVGISNRDWRVRIRKGGGRWAALGSIIDADTAKRIAQQAVENPTETKPSKFAVPLNYLGGYRWDAPELDSPTRAYIRDVEIGAVKVEAPNEQPEASADDESINVCAPDWLVKLLPADDYPDGGGWGGAA